MMDAQVTQQLHDTVTQIATLLGYGLGGVLLLVVLLLALRAYGEVR